MDEEKQKIEETQETENPAPGKIPKYAVILRFWSSPQEIEVDDIIFCQDKLTQRYYYQMIDSTGRMWKNIPEQDVILIVNLPTSKDIEKFSSIKHQILKMEEEEKVCKPEQRDVSVG